MAQATRIRERAAVGRRTRRRRLHRRRVGVLAAVLVLAGLGAVSLIPVLSARAHLETGEAALARGRDLLLGGDPRAAGRAFDLARAAFLDGAASAGNPLLRLQGLLPLAGRSADAVATLAQVGVLTSSTGRDLSDAVARLPGGLSSLAPVRGRVPLDALASLAPAVERARAQLEDARAKASTVPDSFVLGQVSQAAHLAQHELSGAVGVAGSTDAMLGALPSFAGEHGMRRYFVAAQNPAELRGTGGFIGAYAILTAQSGRLTLGPFHDIRTLPNVPASRAPAPAGDFAQIYGPFGGGGFWRNINMTPDAPTAASLIESLYERVAGTRLDGTIFVDPQALAELLQATGPVRVPALGRTLTARNVVPFVENRAYFRFGNQVARKRVLGLAVHGVWDRFLQAIDPAAAIGSLVEAGAGGHLVLHAADPNLQAGFLDAGVAGQLGAARASEPPGGDFFGVFASNSAGTKIDYYVHRALRYDVSLGAGGTGSAQASVGFTNDAPSGARPGYALGPYPGTGLGVGDSLSFVSAYCAPGCELDAATQDGRPAGVDSHSERGYRLYSRFVRVDAQSSSTLGYAFQLARAWQGDDLGGTYRLEVQGQVTSQPTTATVTVRVPDGMRIVDTDVPMQVRGSEATWSGTLSDRQQFVVRFQRPLPGRLWTQIRGFLSQPAARP